LQEKINFDGKVITLSQGDGVFIPAGKKHKAKVLTDTAKAILVEDV
jgi:quercetin dioxygenase-like cupin family protein